MAKPISTFDFDEGIRQLNLFFTPVGIQHKEILWEEFKAIDKTIWDRAIALLRSQHPYKRFPLPAEIWRAIRQAEKRMATLAVAKKTMTNCSRCLDMGWAGARPIADPGTGMTTNVAQYCDCETGQRMKAAHKKAATFPKPHTPRVIYPHADELYDDFPGEPPEPDEDKIDGNVPF
jgi:hypothetical protein